MSDPGIEACIDRGTVPDGWTPLAWTVRLKQLAERCENNRPDEAKLLRAWAQSVIEKHNVKIDPDKQ